MVKFEEPDLKSEPDHRFHVRLGMTRGAFIGFLFLLVLAMIGFWRLETTSHNADKAADQAKAASANANFVAAQNAKVIMSVADLAAKTASLAQRNRILLKQGQQALRVLCAIKRSTREQVREQVQFLAEIETGKREQIQGLSNADIVAAIARQQKFLASFDVIAC